VNEILGLKWSNIDFEQKSLSVTQQLKRINGGYEISDDLKTNSSYRTISLDDETLAQLRKQKLQQSKERLATGSEYQDQDLVIATSLGNFVLPSNLNRTYWNLIRGVGIKRIRFHDLRHTHATLLLKEGVHPKIVQERLGHSNITVTLDRYTHALPNLQKEAAEKIGSSIFGLKNTL
jgi:integrase